MDNLSLPQVARKLEKNVMTLPAAKKFNTLGTEPRKAMLAMSDAVYNLRVNAERFYNADDSKEQAMFLESAQIYAEQANQAILAASNHDLLGAADVAHLSALAGDIKDRLD